MDIHQEVVTRLAALDQRYTRGRRALVDVLAAADRPLTVPEMIGPSVPQSSAYRNLAVLIEAGVVHRIAGADEFARFELAEDVAEHHHHLLCSNCGAVADVAATPRLEKALSEAAVVAAEENGFEVTGHRIDLVGRCAACR
jgi:Fur family transcriptional regulator, ferric uptake regulator